MFHVFPLFNKHEIHVLNFFYYNGMHFFLSENRVYFFICLSSIFVEKRQLVVTTLIFSNPKKKRYET